jgi:hypothetical protein
MKLLLTSAALTVLLALAQPAAAQSKSPSPTPSTPSSAMPGNSEDEDMKSEAQSPHAKPMRGHEHHAAGEATMQRHGRRASEDAMAEELNRQELQRITQGSTQPPLSGSSTRPPSAGPKENNAPMGSGGMK